MVRNDTGHRICIDLGGTKIEVALFNARGEVEWREKMPTYAERGGGQAMDRIGEKVRGVLRARPQVVVGGVGFCSPGPINNKTGIVYDACNVSWGEFPIARELERRLRLPTVVDHDAKVAALGEYYFGLKERERDFVYIVIGTGVGGAIIHNGEVFRGLTNCAGEVGFTCIDYRATHHRADETPGNVESYLGGPDISEYYRAEREKKGLPKGGANALEIGARARAGDTEAQAAVGRGGLALGILISNLAAILDIHLYILGSSVSKLGGNSLTPLMRRFAAIVALILGIGFRFAPVF